MPLDFHIQIAAEDNCKLHSTQLHSILMTMKPAGNYIFCPDNMFTYQSYKSITNLSQKSIRIVVKSKSITLIDETWKISNSINPLKN